MGFSRNGTFAGGAATAFTPSYLAAHGTSMDAMTGITQPEFFPVNSSMTVDQSRDWEIVPDNDEQLFHYIGMTTKTHRIDLITVFGSGGSDFNLSNKVAIAIGINGAPTNPAFIRTQVGGARTAIHRLFVNIGTNDIIQILVRNLDDNQNLRLDSMYFLATAVDLS